MERAKTHAEIANELNNKAAYDRFVTETTRLSGLFNGQESGWEQRVEHVYIEVMTMDYVMGLKAMKEVKQALEALETGFVSALPGSEAQPHEQEIARLPSHKMARELRFLARYADIVLHRDQAPFYPDTALMRKDRKSIALACTNLEADIARYLEDHYFMESLGQYSGPTLAENASRLRAMATVFDEATPSYPSRRAETHDAHTMVDLIAEACFRVFLHCNAKVIRGLVSPSWLKLDFSVTDSKLKTWIAAALDRKVVNYQHRMTEERLNPFESRGRWCPPIVLDL